MSVIFRIPGHFRKWCDGYFPHFRCTIEVDGRHIIPTNVLLDTGSPFTPIMPKDYLRTRLGVAPDRDRNKTCYLASAKFYRVPIDKSVVFKFPTVDGKLKRLPLDDAIFMSPMDDRDMKIVQSIPSILGLNFLTENKLRFFTEPAKDIAYIEGD